MGLFEWLGESVNRGPAGPVKRDDDDESWQPPNRFLVWLLTVLGVGLLGFCTWAILQGDTKWAGFLALAVYLFLAWWLTPVPDHSNMGWAGGIIDNPFRISDDFNRWLVFFALFLLPGKIILYAAQTIINTIGR